MFDVPRIPMVRQKVVGDELKGVLPEEDAKRAAKGAAIPDDVLALGREVAARTRALESVSTLPKLSIDNTADRVFGGFYKIINGEAQCLDGALAPLSPALEARRRAAVRVMEIAFPKRVRFLKADMGLQYQAMRTVVRALRGAELRDEVKSLGLAAHAEHLEAQLGPYGVAVKAPDGGDVEKLSDEWHAAFTRFAGAVVAHWPVGDATRESLLKPYQRELDAHREAQASARRALRVKKKNSSPVT